MGLDLNQLGAMHPRLPPTGEVELYQRRGGLALLRAGHAPDVSASVRNGAEETLATLRWSPSPAVDEALQVIDQRRLTEDGAEAVALAFVHAHSGWTVHRRVQRDGYADWRLNGPANQKMTLVLEVSGTEEGDAQQRLHKKREQVSKNTESDVRAAVVVSFAEPRILAATAAIDAYAEVSRYEEALAALHPADDIDGAIARTGAITAALRAQQVSRAQELARRYLVDPALSMIRREEISQAFQRLAPGASPTRNLLSEARAGLRERFEEPIAA